MYVLRLSRHSSQCTSSSFLFVQHQELSLYLKAPIPGGPSGTKSGAPEIAQRYTSAGMLAFTPWSCLDLVT